ncbi:MAG: hypothetical protein MI864_13930, partial [Pseudomonadales bacterium]|nr:hypothetical protein [Pseudomonadales bacterium]
PKEEWGKYCEYREMVLSDYIAELKTRHAQQHNHYMGQVPVGETPLARLLREPLGHLSETLDME